VDGQLLTVMELTVALVTVNEAVALMLPEAPVMVAEPLATPVALPLASMVAIVVSLLDQVGVMDFVLLSCITAVAVNFCELPGLMIALLGLIVMEVIVSATKNPQEASRVAATTITIICRQCRCHMMHTAFAGTKSTRKHTPAPARLSPVLAAPFAKVT
jgi:hypothetical protein